MAALTASSSRVVGEMTGTGRHTEIAALKRKWNLLARMIKGADVLNPDPSVVDRIIRELAANPKLGTFEAQALEQCNLGCRCNYYGPATRKRNLLAVAVQHSNPLLCRAMIQKAGLSARGISCPAELRATSGRMPVSDAECTLIQSQLLSVGIGVRVTNQFSHLHSALSGNVNDPALARSVCSVAESLIKAGVDLNSMAAFKAEMPGMPRLAFGKLESPLCLALSSLDGRLLPTVPSMLRRGVDLSALRASLWFHEDGGIAIQSIASALSVIIVEVEQGAARGLIDHCVNVAFAYDHHAEYERIAAVLDGCRRSFINSAYGGGMGLVEANLKTFREAVDRRRTSVEASLRAHLPPALSELVVNGYFKWTVPELLPHPRAAASLPLPLPLPLPES